MLTVYVVVVAINVVAGSIAAAVILLADEAGSAAVRNIALGVAISVAVMSLFLFGYAMWSLVTGKALLEEVSGTDALRAVRRLPPLFHDAID